MVLGCYGGNKKPVTPEQLKGRFDAASAMSNIRERDDAFVALAHDAADAGESEFVTKAIDKLTNIAQKDSTAHSCALTLSERGKSQAAVEIAKKISNLAKQNEALGRIARGQ